MGPMVAETVPVPAPRHAAAPGLPGCSPRAARVPPGRSTPMHRSTFLSLPAGRLARAAPVAAGLALVAAVVPAGKASAAPAGCTTSGNPVTRIFLETGGAQTWTVPSRVTQATLTPYGAEGNNHSRHPASGLGANGTATLPVTTGT